MKVFFQLLISYSQETLMMIKLFTFLEDDYLHRPGWCDVLMEGFTVDNDSYVTMYDFDFFIAKGFFSEIFFH